MRKSAKVVVFVRNQNDGSYNCWNTAGPSDGVLLTVEEARVWAENNVLGEYMISKVFDHYKVENVTKQIRVRTKVG